MFDEEEHPGLEALCECSEEVQITIKNYLPEITIFLRKNKIMDLSLFAQVNHPHNPDPPNTKATLVFQRLQDMVQLDEKYYRIFVDFLRKSPKYESTVKILDEVYCGPDPAVQQGKAEPPSRMSILAGCDTKGVCAL